MKFKDFKFKKIGAIALLSTFLGVLIWCGWTMLEMWRYQGEIAPNMQRTLGFRHGSPYVNINGQEVEVFTIHPVKGGHFEEVGFGDGDIVVSDSITGFYKLLKKSNGRTISVTVVDGGDGPPLDQRQKRVLEFQVVEK